MERDTNIETINDCGVTVMGDKVAVFRPFVLGRADEALRHAAWLVVLAEATGRASAPFDDVRRAVQNT